ncbi:restriction endonuclease subunit S [Metamycoplasma hyosynoviae]|uniref:restriction endonuclease subunit S n=1 Tax=Metamycoplasma hyosynoviae TaxID=29559 RepID=UPI00235F65D8|nr:restriction endonuclease subunit S [Metamycoplasma hyosynoviae]MDD1373984.1 restriction endonuclease subunit S [Metamycoplasma hyosynoviae]
MNYLKIRNLSHPQKGFYGIGASATEYNDQYPQYLRITDIDDNCNVSTILPTCVDINVYPKWNQYLLKVNDIVFARTGNSTGRNYFCKKIKKDTVFSGFLVKFSINPELIIPNYVGYYCQSPSYWKQIRAMFTGSTRANINAKQYADLLIPIVDRTNQHHIVNTIGSVDNLIENLTKQNEILMTLGISKINQFNNSYEKKSLNKIVKFEKGFEVGSSKYIEIYKKGLINYLRVGDLLSLGNTYIDEKDSDKIAKFEDILVAFDGSPGRNSIGLVGAYSSGIYNLKSTNNDKGLVYFEMNSDINKKIIDNHSQGTTILHASKSINYLVYVDVDDNDKKVLNNYFYLILQNKKKINFLNKIKDNLLDKYF